MRLLHCCICALVLFASCKSGRQVTGRVSPADTVAHKHVTGNKDSGLLYLSRQILTVIKDQRYRDLATYIHPEAGVRFSAYAFVDTSGDLRFTKASWLKALEKPQNTLTWGSYDGSGDPITLSIPAYFKKFVYDVDFLQAEQVSINEMIGRGNSLNNLEAVYKDCDFTEFYFPGFNKRHEGMDWRTLRLVFKQWKGKYYLTGVVHDEWTI